MGVGCGVEEGGASIQLDTRANGTECKKCKIIWRMSTPVGYMQIPYRQ